MFASLSDRLTSTLASLRGSDHLAPAQVEKVVGEIRRALLEADVAVPVVRAFTTAVRDRALGAPVADTLTPEQQVVKIVHDELVTVLGGQRRDLTIRPDGPTVIMLAGLQGAGKTTLAGKLAHHLAQQGHAPLLVAADLQRPSAVAQLQVLADRAGAAVFAPHAGVQASNDAQPGRDAADPVAVARDGVAFARAGGHDVVIIDTAGRTGVDEAMMTQAAAIRDATVPDEVLFVIDAMVGQDAVATATAFAAAVDFTGVVLSKLDGDTRGGAALSIASVTARPVMFASTGEKLTDFEVFHPDRMASRILDMGDVLTLIEQAERAMDTRASAAMVSRLAAGGDLTLEDFLVQVQGLRRMGSMKKVLGMLPGMGQVREAIDNFDEKAVTRMEAIVQAMTPGERAHPEAITEARRAKIAAGSGTTVAEVEGLLERFAAAKTTLRDTLRHLPSLESKKARARSASPTTKSHRGRSGNPAKRAAERDAGGR